MKGLVHIYEGTGKGKSTAGVGLTIRCAGNGFPVVYSQFLKDGTTGEMNITEDSEYYSTGGRTSFWIFFSDDTGRKSGGEGCLYGIV